METTEHPLAQLVKRSLQAKDRELQGISVGATSHDTVHLSGSVRSFYLKQVAVSIAKHVPGVRQVRDGISVVTLRPVETGSKERCRLI